MFNNLSLNGLKLVRPSVYKDRRGFFVETYKKSSYTDEGIDLEFVQDNHSFSKKGTLRGLHYQAFPGQAKLVTVISGEIFDVAVDIRKDSPTFGKWESVILNDSECHQLFIPVGFAHGFYVLSDEAHVVYKVSAPYDPLQEKGIRFDDPELAIAWPEGEKFVSDRDAANPTFHEVFSCVCGS